MIFCLYIYYNIIKILAQIFLKHIKPKIIYFFESLHILLAAIFMVSVTIKWIHSINFPLTIIVHIAIPLPYWIEQSYTGIWMMLKSYANRSTSYITFAHLRVWQNFSRPSLRHQVDKFVWRSMCEYGCVA